MQNIQNSKIAVIGLGYVGLPLACLFARKYSVVGFDVSKSRVEELLSGHDSTDTFTDAEMQASLRGGLTCTSDEAALDTCNVYIVAVPTPVDKHHLVDLRPLIGASEVVGRHISKGDVVVYESTVYPGATEEDCLPVVERVSGLKFNVDFFAGYSPERVNPGDREHTVERIKKVTSGSTPAVADFVDRLYGSVLENGTHKAPTMRVAEACKIVENCQRDVNIAFMNEIDHIFNAMGINTRDVLEAAGTKWNFIRLEPGLVGGHCIGVDPYYLIQRAMAYRESANLLTAARRINDTMGKYIADQVVKLMNLTDIAPKSARVLVLGFTFKENCNDIRNTKVIDVVHELNQFCDTVTIADPYAIPALVKQDYGVDIVSDIAAIAGQQYDAILLCVKHREFATLPVPAMLRPGGILCDIKGFYRSAMQGEPFYHEI
ncbi:MAG: nucleotide sugar dehydrogenase [Bacteroidaceae bacterium]|nr:nucleotide sugar dehydrogenase [Bacteroidaceae bacterium]MBQ9642311.1 nucleotide sugar dehydrogenase [Bacteroidaceae bacterium]